MKTKKWRTPSEKKMRDMAAALGIYGARTRPLEDIKKAVNNWLLGSMMGKDQR